MSKKNTDIIKHRYNRISNVFNVMDGLSGLSSKKSRKKLLKSAKGNVLEIGVGTGANIEFYPKDTTVTGIDFSPKMLEKARKKVDNLNLDINILEMDVEQLDFPDDSFDTVVATCVFCSVPNPIQGLKEIRRVTKANGKIIMLEHMRSDNEFVGKIMDILNPIGLHIVGANINRRTMDNIRKSQLQVTHEELLMSSILRELTLSPNKKEIE